MLVESMLNTKEFFQKWYLQAFQYSGWFHFVKSKDVGSSGSEWLIQFHDVESSCWLAQGTVVKLYMPISPSRITSSSLYTKEASSLYQGKVTALSTFQVTSAPQGHSSLSI